jgi:adenine-specific DNA-methyltransferase
METLNLFEDITVDAPPTESVKYAGSKLKLLPYILQLTRKTNPNTILDGFSGTTRVAQAFARSGYQVIANDSAVWSKVFATCYLLNKYPKEHYKDLIEHLNSLPGKDGWFTENYGGAPNGGCARQADNLKKPWQIHNTRKLDAIREEIDNLVLDETERSVALTSLILALDSVDSTIGHYAAYLNKWSPRSYNEMLLNIPNFVVSEKEHRVLQDDIFNVLDSTEVDLAYFDPPYGSNNEKMPPSRVRYAAYYHIWTTICLNDKPQLFGKARRRVDTSDKVAASIFADELNESIRKCGKVKEVIEVDYKKNVMADMRWTSEWVRDAELPNKEFLFLIEKD